MQVVLVDTSVWINVFKGIETPASLFLKNNNQNIIVATCPSIVQETLQGVVSAAQFTEINNYFFQTINLRAHSYHYAREAAVLYRKLRKRGVTIRKPNDCLIAIYAIRNDVAILHDDRDFTNIAAFSDLKTVPV